MPGRISTSFSPVATWLPRVCIIVELKVVRWGRSRRAANVSKLSGDLSRAAWETVRAMMAEAAGDPCVRPGMVVVPQTFGSSVNTHPHVHAIASRGVWTKDGMRVPIPYVDAGAAARLFRHKVLRLLVDAELIDEERVAMILGWRHTSGFSVQNQVVVHADDGDGLERLARYLARPPVSLQRMEWDRETGEVLYRTGAAGMPRSVRVRTRAGMMSGTTSSGSTSWSFWRAWSRNCRSRGSIRFGTTATTPRSSGPNDGGRRPRPRRP